MFKEKELTQKIIGTAIEVHKQMGPGLLKSVYEECLLRELDLQEISFLRQVSLPIEYKGIKLESSLKLDLLIENKVIVELKAVDSILPIYQAQILSYMKLAKKRVGLLINFNITKLTDGIERFVL